MACDLNTICFTNKKKEQNNKGVQVYLFTRPSLCVTSSDEKYGSTFFHANRGNVFRGFGEVHYVKLFLC